MRNNTFTFNGIDSAEFGIKVESFPTIVRSARKYTEYSVNGRNGSIYDVQNAWEEAYITYHIYAGGPTIGAARDAFYSIMEWLHSADDYAELTDTFDPMHYRRAIFLDSAEIESMWYQHGRAAITFRCTPERFLTTRHLEPTVSGGTGSILNPTSNIAKPLITLTGGSSVPNLLNTVGRTEVTQSGDLRYFRNINTPNIYKGVYYTGASADPTKITSYTATTAGSITVNSSDTSYGIGLNVPVQGNTPYYLSGTNGRFYILQCDRDGRVLKNHGGAAVGYAFMTLPTTRYIVIVFTPASANTALTQSNLMLSAGKTIPSYVAYSTAASTLRFKNIMMTIAFPFNELTIDCENERVYSDVLDYSKYVSLQDVNYGDPTSDFLRLLPGANAFAYTGATAMSLDPRFWEV